MSYKMGDGNYCEVADAADADAGADADADAVVFVVVSNID